MMIRLLSLLLCLTLAVLSGCTTRQGSAASAKAVEPPVCAVIAVDGTGSYEYLEKAKATIVKVIQGLPAGSKVYVRWITEDSVSDKNAIVSAVLPDMGKPKNTFDLKERQRYAIMQKKAAQIKAQIDKVITAAVSPKAKMTDIYGALYSAGIRFSANPNLTPVLILLTDMDDNVKKAYPVALCDAAVMIMDFQVGTDDAKVRTTWTEYLTKAGAQSVQFMSLDEPLMLGRKQ